MLYAIAFYTSLLIKLFSAIDIIISGQIAGSILGYNCDNHHPSMCVCVCVSDRSDKAVCLMLYLSLCISNYDEIRINIYFSNYTVATAHMVFT